MVVQTRSTKKPVSGSLAAATKKRPILYIPQSDYRANKDYINSYPGQIVVLSEADYSLWLRQEYDVSSSSSYFSQINDSEDISQYSDAKSDLKAPGVPKWNTKDISYVSTDTGILQNITVTFDPSPDDPGDGSFTYHVNYVPTTATTVSTPSTTPAPTSGIPAPSTPVVTGTGSSGSATSSTQSASNVNNNIDATTLAASASLSSMISISWSLIPSAVSYSVTMTGHNIPGVPNQNYTHTYVVPSAGGSSNNSSYASSYLDRYGTYTFTVTNQSGYLFSGTYTFNIQVNYASSSSLGVPYSVTIH
jgi:hypothetical protein